MVRIYPLINSPDFLLIHVGIQNIIYLFELFLVCDSVDMSCISLMTWPGYVVDV